MGALIKAFLRWVAKRAAKKAAERAAKEAAKRAAKEAAERAAKEAAERAKREAAEAAKKARQKFNKNKKGCTQGCNEAPAGPKSSTGSGLTRQTAAQLRKSKASLERLIKEHRQKLADYKRDPLAFDNEGTLRNAPEHLKSKIIEGRIQTLEKQIAKQEGELRKVNELLGGAQ